MSERYFVTCKVVQVSTYNVIQTIILMTLKASNGANFDITKIARASLLFQTDFPDCCFD